MVILLLITTRDKEKLQASLYSFSEKLDPRTAGTGHSRTLHEFKRDLTYFKLVENHLAKLLAQFLQKPGLSLPCKDLDPLCKRKIIYGVRDLAA